MKKDRLQQTNAEIQRIIKDGYKKLYANKMNNLEEMDRFLEKFNLPRLNQEKIETMNKAVISTKIKTDQKSPTNKSSGPDGFIGEIY